MMTCGILLERLVEWAPKLKVNLGVIKVICQKKPGCPLDLDKCQDM